MREVKLRLTLAFYTLYPRLAVLLIRNYGV